MFFRVFLLVVAATLSSHISLLHAANLFEALMRDVTKNKEKEKSLAEAYDQLKEAQQQLIQTEKMAAMGQLAAGISHELNQALTGIRGFALALVIIRFYTSQFYF